MPGRQIAKLSLCLVLLLIVQGRVAGAGPTADLDQIKIISFSTFIEGDQAGKCRINQDALNTALRLCREPINKIENHNLCGIDGRCKQKQGKAGRRIA